MPAIATVAVAGVIGLGGCGGSDDATGAEATQNNDAPASQVQNQGTDGAMKGHGDSMKDDKGSMKGHGDSMKDDDAMKEDGG